MFVLNYLTKNIINLKIIIIRTLRPQKNNIITSTLEQIKTKKIIVKMTLGYLEKNNVSALIKKIYSPNDFSNNFVNDLTNHCKNNPFFLIELLRQMRQKESIS